MSARARINLGRYGAGEEAGCFPRILILSDRELVAGEWASVAVCLRFISPPGVDEMERLSVL
jgi:hypothetical protein